jgi:hypothetical protein
MTLDLLGITVGIWATAEHRILVTLMNLNAYILCFHFCKFFLRVLGMSN